MILRSIQISDFRNISTQLISFSRQFNVFHGDNAAGKTSILEAIYYLSTGKSFRSNHHDVVITFDKAEFTLFSQLFDDNLVIPVGLRRSRDGSVQIHLREESIRSITEVSQILPVLFIGADSHRILTDGPKVRRQFLDWGLFYTCPQFYPQWRQYQKLLAHRNAALKNRVSREELLVWDLELAKSGQALHLMRESYFVDFMPVFQDIISVFLNDMTVSAQYSPGWNTELSLLDSLKKHQFREMQIGHTLSGPHRADLVLTVDNLLAEDILSQGQQKLVSYALRLAQGIHLKTMTNKAPIFLIDDLPSELDSLKQRLVAQILAKIKAQVFVTGIYSHDLEKICLEGTESKVFHVKQGEIVDLVDA